jgi:hypothetical protein
VTQHAQLPVSGSVSRHTQRLFSDYFLDHILPKEHPWKHEWQELRSEASAVMAELRQHYAKFVPSKNEAQTEDDWIKPVLLSLGHIFEVQAPLKTGEGTKRPDYFFYLDEAARVAHKNKPLTDEMLQQSAFAVGAAKPWDLRRTARLRVAARGAIPSATKTLHTRFSFICCTEGCPWAFLRMGDTGAGTRSLRQYRVCSGHQ